MIKVLVNGCNGRMGKEVINVLDSYEDMLLIGGFDNFNDNQSTYPVYTDINNISEVPDVIIDFSVPKASLNMLRIC